MNRFLLRILFAVMLFLFPFFLAAQPFQSDGVTITAIRHATFVIQSDQLTIIVDPVGNAAQFSDYPNPDIILVTDIHGDHLNPDIIKALKGTKTSIIGPGAAVKDIPGSIVLDNNQERNVSNIQIKALPAYNTTTERSHFHPKGRGNGYLLMINQKKIYISGDTEDIPEMRSLKDIDIAFLCMNLPYTMTVDQAISAVLEFQPKIVIPYHYRGKGGLSDLNKFKQGLASNNRIKVELLKWY